MKKEDRIFVLIVLVVFGLLALVTPFAVDAVAAKGNPVDTVAVVHAQNGGEIVDPVQLYFIGAIATALVYLLKLAAKKWPQLVIKREWLTVGLYVISFVLALLWGGMSVPVFPAFDDPITFVAALFGFASAFLISLAIPVSFATLIYNVLLKRVFDNLAIKAGWLEAQAQ